MRMFDAATSVPALTEAWIRTLKNGGGPGGDGETLQHFARAADFRLARLSHELQADLYRPGPLRRLQVPKRSGGMRPLSIPCVVDRIAQRAAATVLSAALEPTFSDASFGYRPGRSVSQAVARVDYLRRQGFSWVVDADIKGFFDNVPHAPLLDRLRQAGIDAPLCDLIALWLESFSDNGVGLAQGSPLSPILANLHLDALDDSFGDKGPVRIVRFADDFVLLTRCRPGAEAALAKAQERLAEGGLRLNLEKTRIVPFDQALRFLGHLFLRGMVMPSDEEDAPLGALTHAGGADEERAAPAAPREEPAPRADPTPASVASPPASFDPDGEDDLSPGQVPLYLFEPGYRLVAEREGFTVIGHDRPRLRLPATMVSRIDLGAEVEAEDAALRLAAAHGIPVALLNEAGLPQSVLMPTLTGDAALHMAQARLALDPARAEDMAALLVAGRLRNAHALLKRLNRRRADPAVEEACTVLHYGWRKVEAPRRVAEARAVEAEGARAYWPALSACLEHGFALPSRRDPERATPVNAVLDYTASLLIRDMRSAVLRARLHPGFGVLHATTDGRDACVYDLVEPFRAPLAEGLAVYLLNNRILRAADFVVEPPKSARAHGVRLLPAASRKLVQGYETWMARPILDPVTARRTTWRSLLLTEARRFARMAEDGTPWTPYRMKH
jgi:CRISP-associated protein Cas1